jgi:hypothetical protein
MSCIDCTHISCSSFLLLCTIHCLYKLPQFMDIHKLLIEIPLNLPSAGASHPKCRIVYVTPVCEGKMCMTQNTRKRFILLAPTITTTTVPESTLAD